MTLATLNSGTKTNGKRCGVCVCVGGGGGGGVVGGGRNELQKASHSRRVTCQHSKSAQSRAENNVI